MAMAMVLVLVLKLDVNVRRLGWRLGTDVDVLTRARSTEYG